VVKNERYDVRNGALKCDVVMLVPPLYRSGYRGDGATTLAYGMGNNYVIG
jgi:hypothetical protein